MSQMSPIRSLYRALFRRSANIYVSKLRFAIVWLGQIQNLDTGHVYVLGFESGFERLSGRRVLELMLPFNPLYQACSGPGLCEFPVGTFQLPGSRNICISFGHLEVKIGKTESWRNTYRGIDLNKTKFVPGGFSCTNSPPCCTWPKVVDGYNRNIFSLPKDYIRISCAFATLMRPIVRNTRCDPLFFTTSLILSKPDWLNESNIWKLHVHVYDA